MAWRVESYTFKRTVPADVYKVKGKISALRAPGRSTARISMEYDIYELDGRAAS